MQGCNDALGLPTTACKQTRGIAAPRILIFGVRKFVTDVTFEQLEKTSWEQLSFHKLSVVNANALPASRSSGEAGC
jgi:hypothetical protein